MLGVDTLCPFGEEHLETEAFQRHIDGVINYIESEDITAQIAANWRIIGDYQDTVQIVHTLSRSDLLVSRLRIIGDYQDTVQIVHTLSRSDLLVSRLDGLRDATATVNTQ